MTKDEYVGKYLDKKMKNHNLPYGMQYLNLVAKHTEYAEKKWEKLIDDKINKHLKKK